MRSETVTAPEANPLRLLVVEDSESDAQLMIHELERAGYAPDWTRVDLEKDFRTALDPLLDLILSDYTMPSFGAPRALELLQESGLDIPFIVVTGTVGEEVAVQCIKLGASNYVLKDRLGRLAPAVGQALQAKTMRDRQREVQRALLESERKFRTAFENAAIGMALADTEGLFLEVNHALCEMLGYEEEELLALSFSEITHPEDEPNCRWFFDDLLESGKDTAAIRKRFLHQNGEVVHVEVSAFLVREPDDTPLYFVTHVLDVTERVRAFEALRESEKRYRQMFEENAAVKLLVDFESGRIVDANGAACRFYGYDREALLSKTIYDINTQSREDISAEMRRALEKKSPFFYFRHRLVSGEERDVQVFSGPLTISGRSYLHSIVHDVTDRKKAEEALRMTQFSLDHAADPAFWVDRDGRILYANHAASRTLGYSEEELTSLTIHDLDAGRDSGHWPTFWENIKKRGSLTFETMHRRKDGTSFPAEVSVNYLNFDGREFNFSFVRDISERKEAERALAGSEERFRLLIERAPVGIWIVRGQEIQYANPAALRMFGYESLNDIQGSSVLDRVAPRYRDEIAKRLIRREAGLPMAAGTEIMGLRKDGGEFPVHAEVANTEIDGAPAVIGFFMDLSALREVEEQLRQAQKMEAIGQLAGGIAHDFNNLLMAIQGPVELMQGRLKDDDPLQPELELVRGAAERASGLTRQLLAFARRQVLKPAVLDLNEVLREMVPMLQRLLPENVRLGFIPTKPLKPVSLDRTQFEQVLVNLCINARDAMPEGGRIVLETAEAFVDETFGESYPWAKAGEYALFSVTDDGAGMDEETLSKIFEPFFSTKGPSGGTGLGLSTVYGIVKQHGGMVAAYSEPGLGTMFKLYFPVSAESSPSKGLNGQSEIRGGNEHLLVVEDEAAVREVVVEALQSLGYDVEHAKDGESALRRVRNGTGFDLVVTDMVMPGLGGLQLAEEIRKLAPSTRFLFTSGYSESTLDNDFRQGAGRHFLGKPYSIKTLARVVRAVLDEPAQNDGNNGSG
ncbi:MAG: PAS domain S-box protein [Acidobacteriota bacterium]